LTDHGPQKSPQQLEQERREREEKFKQLEAQQPEVRQRLGMQAASPVTQPAHQQNISVGMMPSPPPLQQQQQSLAMKPQQSQQLASATLTARTAPALGGGVRHMRMLSEGRSGVHNVPSSPVRIPANEPTPSPPPPLPQQQPQSQPQPQPSASTTHIITQEDIRKLAEKRQ
jgi:hypothetical protein